MQGYNSELAAGQVWPVMSGTHGLSYRRFPEPVVRSVKPIPAVVELKDAIPRGSEWGALPVRPVGEPVRHDIGAEAIGATMNPRVHTAAWIGCRDHLLGGFGILLTKRVTRQFDPIGAALKQRIEQSSRIVGGHFLVRQRPALRSSALADGSGSRRSTGTTRRSSSGPRPAEPAAPNSSAAAPA